MSKRGRNARGSDDTILDAERRMREDPSDTRARADWWRARFRARHVDEEDLLVAVLGGDYSAGAAAPLNLVRTSWPGVSVELTWRGAEYSLDTEAQERLGMPAGFIIPDFGNVMEEISLGEVLDTYRTWRSAERGLWGISLGQISPTFLLLISDNLDDALEAAASWAEENEPGVFVEPDYDDAEDPEEAEADLTYTESGWLLSDDWGYWMDPDHVDHPVRVWWLAAEAYLLFEREHEQGGIFGDLKEAKEMLSGTGDGYLLDLGDGRWLVTESKRIVQVLRVHRGGLKYTLFLDEFDGDETKMRAAGAWGSEP